MCIQVGCHHTSVGLTIAYLKPQNVLVNYGQGDMRFTDVQLSNWGNSAPAYEPYTRYRDLIGTPTRRSPEAHFRIGWGTPTDV